MNVENQITNLSNPGVFTSLFNALMSAEHRNDFQPINDDVRDGGNDGYLYSQERLHACHCFKKINTVRTDAEKFIKMKSDFNKAVALKSSKSFGVKNWTFVSNYKISNALWLKMINHAKGTGIKVNAIGPEYLAVLAIKYPDIALAYGIDAFGFGHQDLKEMHVMLSKILGNDTSTVSGKHDSQDDVVIQPQNIDLKLSVDETDIDSGHPDFVRAMELNRPNATEQELDEIRQIIYTTDSDSAKVQAVFSLTQMFNPAKDNPQDWIDLIDIGITTAKNHKWPSDLAVLQSLKATYIGNKQIHFQINYWELLSNAQIFGSEFISQDRIKVAYKDLEKLDEERRATFGEAMEVSKQANDWETYGRVLMHMGESSGAIAMILHRAGDEERARANLSLTRQSFTQSKYCFDRINNKELGLYSLYNLANQLRAFEPEKNTAIKIAEKVRDESKALGVKVLHDQAVKLINHIRSGDIPDTARHRNA